MFHPDYESKIIINHGISKKNNRFCLDIVKHHVILTVVIHFLYNKETKMLHRISKLILAVFCMMAACHFLCGKTSNDKKDIKMNQVLSQPFFVNIIPLDPGNEKRDRKSVV